MLLILKDSVNPDVPLQAICNHGIVGLSIPADKHDYSVFKHSSLVNSRISIIRNNTNNVISVSRMFPDDVKMKTLIGSRTPSNNEWISILRIIMLMNRIIRGLSDTVPMEYSAFIPALNDVINEHMPVEYAVEHLKMIIE